MENEFDPHALIGKFMRRECSPEELRRLVRYLEEQQNEPELLRWMESDWRAAGPDQVLDEARSGAMLENILGRQAQPAPATGPATDRRTAFQKYWPAAAVLLLLAAAAGFRAAFKVRRAIPVTYATWGEPVRLPLPDGSVVYLNRNSSLTYQSFRAGRREAALTGEGFFEVAGRPEHPFLVTTRKAVIRVLGTRFNVKENPADGSVWVAVTEGEVTLAAGGARSPEPVHLVRNQLGLVGRDGSVRVEEGETANYASWLSNGRLRFRNTPLPEAIRQLERLYGVTIRLQDPALAALRLTAIARKDSLPALLDNITLSLGITYHSTPDGITLLTR